MVLVSMGVVYDEGKKTLLKTLILVSEEPICVMARQFPLCNVFLVIMNKNNGRFFLVEWRGGVGTTN